MHLSLCQCVHLGVCASMLMYACLDAYLPMCAPVCVWLYVSIPVSMYTYVCMHLAPVHMYKPVSVCTCGCLVSTYA